MKSVELAVPPDKSISHRALMLASISEGTTQIKSLLMAEDIKRTMDAFRAMGVAIKVTKSQSHKDTSADVVVHGVGMPGLKKPSRPLYLGNSGTTMRLLPGILAGQDFEACLTGDRSLSNRPMKRIVAPLRKMGAEIASAPSVHRNDPFSVIASGAKQSHEIYPPLKIHGGRLRAIRYKSRIASAQVKSCVLLAGLYADGVTSVSEPVKSRDHTERMLKMFGCRLTSVPSTSISGISVRGKASAFAKATADKQGSRVSLKGPVELKSPGTIEIPRDISSAAFFIVAGSILPGIKIAIKDVGLNPTRTGVLDILKRMGANIEVRPLPPRRWGLNPTYAVGEVGEPAGDVIVRTSQLKGVTISSEEVVRAIDEIPIIMVAACFAKGKTVIKGIEELHIKETDRIKSMVMNLRKIGAILHPYGESIVINGGKKLHGAKVSSFGDHRTAMSMLIAGLMTRGRVTVTGLDCINKSFPNFKKLLRRFA